MYVCRRADVEEGWCHTKGEHSGTAQGCVLTQKLYAWYGVPCARNAQGRAWTKRKVTIDKRREAVEGR